MGDPSHIQKLPNELLAKVFVFSNPEDSWEFSPIEKDALGRIMLVCRHWRQVAVSTTDLWCTIDIAATLVYHWQSLDINPPDYLQCVEKASRYLALILPRTADALLEIRFHDERVATHILPNIIEAHGHRLRKVMVGVRSPQGVPQSPDVVRLLMGASLPHLEELHMQYNISTRDPVPIEDRTHLAHPAFTLDRFPALRTLQHASLIVYESSIPLISKLTILDLDSCSFHFDSSQPLNRFIDVLKGCQSLRDLCLRNVLNSHPLPQERSSSQVIKLEKLSSLTILDEPAYTSWFLSCISIDADVDLHVTGMLNQDFGHFANSIAEHFASLYPTSMASRLQTATHGYLYQPQYSWPGRVRMTIGSPKTCLTIECLGRQGYSRPSTINHTFSAFGRVYAGAAITKLDILSVDFNVSYEARASEPWVHLFSQFPDVKELELGNSGWGPLFGIISALGLPPPIQVDGELSVDFRKRTPVCPKLESVGIGGTEWEIAGMVESLISVLRRRSAFGLPKWKLELMSGYPRWTGELKQVLALYHDDLFSNIDILEFQ